jgi:hypothetical protein
VAAFTAILAYTPQFVYSNEEELNRADLRQKQTSMPSQNQTGVENEPGAVNGGSSRTFRSSLWNYSLLLVDAKGSGWDTRRGAALINSVDPSGKSACLNPEENAEGFLASAKCEPSIPVEFS